MLFDDIEESAQALRSGLGIAAGDASPQVAVVLGSGLGAWAESLSDALSVPYSAIPHMRPTTAPSHAGRFAFGKAQGTPVLAMQGRYHLYEGISAEQVAYPIHVLARLGIRELVLTNASGGINERLSPGDIMLVEDHINLLGANPLSIPFDERVCNPVASMTHVYPQKQQATAREAATAAGVRLKSGVYLATPGPTFETPTEIRAFRTLGADAVGMSTVLEAIAACAHGIPVTGLSVITNMAAGITGAELSNAEVFETASRSADRFTALLNELVPRLDSFER